MLNETGSNSMALLRVHLQDKSPDELVALLLELIQQVDEATRQQFWSRLAPPGLATADLRYPSAELFLAELAAFVTAVDAGDYFDSQAQEYYGQDPADRRYYGWEYDPADHAGLSALRQFLVEAHSYFRAGRYDVAAAAYGTLIAITMDGNPYETLGIDSPLAELGQTESTLVEHYFAALQQSRAVAEFFEAALSLVARHDQPYRPYTDHFLSLLDAEQRVALCVHLETWADELDKQALHTFPVGIPLQLRLLFRLNTEADQPEKVMAMQHRFRRRYLALYMPLLAGCEAAQDWATLITYGQEVLALVPPEPGRPGYYSPPREKVDVMLVRTQLVRAYEAFGEPEQGFVLYEPVFANQPNYETYATARRLAAAISPERGRGFTRQTITSLRRQLPGFHYLLCQIYLSEDQFEEAYSLLDDVTGYEALEALKLVAKAHLLAALGMEVRPEMGPRLTEMYGKLAESDKKPARFLREHLTNRQSVSRVTALERAESLYRRIIELHIDNGRKTYATAAYYCALLGEIAAYEGRQEAFDRFYQELLGRYARRRALRAELTAQVGH